MKKRHQYFLDNKLLSYNLIPALSSKTMDIAILSHVIVSCHHSSFPNPERNVLRRILIVDSKPVAADMAALMCATFGCLSTTASSLEEACTAAQQHAFDLIITDYYLPPDNGLMLICRLRQLGLEMPAVVMTDRASISGYLQPSILNIAKVLIKPFTRTALKTVLDECLR